MGRETKVMTDERFDVVVVGAGLAGLVAGVEAARSGARTVVLDAHPAGGRARTTDRAGYLFNEGPHALYEAGPLMALLRRWGQEPDGGRPSSSVHALLGGALHPFPTGPRDLARTPLLRPSSRVRFGRLMLGLPRCTADRLSGRSLSEWFDDESLPADVRALLMTLVRVTSYADAPDLMDAGAASAQLQAGLRGVRYLDGGWQRIVDGLRRALATAGGTLHERVAVGAVDSDGVTARTHTIHGAVDSAAVVLAGLAPAEATRLLSEAAGWLGDLGPPVEAVCLQLALHRPPASPIVLGVDQPLYLSAHAPLARLAPSGGAMVEVMQYRAPGRATDAESDRTELDGLRRLVGLEDDDILDERFLRRMTVAHALPLARRGGLVGRPAVGAPEPPNVFLAGDWVGPMGMLGDAAAASALEAARSAVGVARRVGAGVAR
jgi:phytoene dehydrogenase-like protein